MQFQTNTSQLCMWAQYWIINLHVCREHTYLQLATQSCETPWHTIDFMKKQQKRKKTEFSRKTHKSYKKTKKSSKIIETQLFVQLILELCEMLIFGVPSEVLRGPPRFLRS